MQALNARELPDGQKSLRGKREHGKQWRFVVCVAVASALAIGQSALATPQHQQVALQDVQRRALAAAHKVARASVASHGDRDSSGLEQALASGVPVDEAYLAAHPEVASQVGRRSSRPARYNIIRCSVMKVLQRLHHLGLMHRSASLLADGQQLT